MFSKYFLSAFCAKRWDTVENTIVKLCVLLGLTFWSRTWVERQSTNKGGKAGVPVGTRCHGKDGVGCGGVTFEQGPGGERE